MLSDILSDKSQIDHSYNEVLDMGFDTHGDKCKNWDSLICFKSIVSTIPRNASILDAGGELYSKILPWLRGVGYSDLTAINLTFSHLIKNGIKYIYGNIESTEFSNNSIDVVTCLSVLEHGINQYKFFNEMSRIMRSGSPLYISVDYEYDKINCDGIIAFDVPMMIFSKDDINQMLDISSKYGFKHPKVNLHKTNKPVTWNGKSYGFFYIEMLKE